MPYTTTEHTTEHTTEPRRTFLAQVGTEELL